MSGVPDKALDLFCADVELELRELGKLGVRVPRKAVALAQNRDGMREYHDNGMSVSECADLQITLADMQ